VSSSPTDTQTHIEVTMPQVGVSIAEATVTAWRKEPGEWIDADEILCDTTSDKIDVEIPSPAAGRLVRTLVEPGETVDVGTPIAVLDTGGGKSTEPAPSSADAGAGGRTAAGNGDVDEIDRSSFISPVVRRIADEHGVDLSRIEGTGVGGRIRKTDVLAHVEQGAPEAGDGATHPAEKQLHIESPYRPEAPEPAAKEPAAAEPEVTPPTPEEQVGRRLPMSPMRKQIAEHMLRSRSTSAHCTTVAEVDFSRVLARRAELKDAFAGRRVQLTPLAFVALALVETLLEHPRFNASVEGEEIVEHADVNLGLAVALDEGLIVPVIHRAQHLGLEGLAARISELSQRAREGRLSPEDVHGGTFTLTNPGRFGSVLATPIINQPQVAILDTEAIVKRPVVVEADEGDQIAIRPMCNLCMSWDHRALDGVDAARFLGKIRERLEGWEASA
jgi:pyruvate/2-oxoglutarate dehydrogenase complex dihydrolipoamide acyltransferase (E2) component